jgi:hypothetical protein
MRFQDDLLEIAVVPIDVVGPEKGRESLFFKDSLVL